MSKKQLLLLDAGAIIGAHELGAWSAMRASCALVSGETVLDDESNYWMDPKTGEKIPITSLDGVEKISASLAQVQALRARFPKLKLDPGEAELLAWFVAIPAGRERPKVVTSDKALWLALGQAGLGEDTLSLEEVLAKIGQARKSVAWKYSRAFREKSVGEGFVKGL